MGLSDKFVSLFKIHQGKIEIVLSCLSSCALTQFGFLESVAVFFLLFSLFSLRFFYLTFIYLIYPGHFRPGYPGHFVPDYPGHFLPYYLFLS